MTPRRVDVLVGCGAAVLAIADTLAEGNGIVVAAMSAVMGGALGAVRRHPRAAWIVAAVALFAMAPTAVWLTVSTGFVLAPTHAFCAARWDGRWGGIAAAAALIGSLVLAALIEGESIVPYVLVPGAAWFAGRALRERELIATQLADRARELEEEREAHASLSVRYERARIASELHDIVAHAISVMVVQASAGQRLAAHDPELTAETFEAIAGAARQAEDDMGRLVALLGDEDAQEPAPDLALVEELVARASGSGLDVKLRLEGDREGLPAPLAQIAFRVVREGLTNALRYASGATVTVLVRGERDALVVEVSNGPASSDAELAGTGTGNGLRGLRERIAEVGGKLDAGRTPDGGWLLAAVLSRRGRLTAPTAGPRWPGRARTGQPR